MRASPLCGHDYCMTKTSFSEQLQAMWRTRPVRFPRKGPVAGVAAGIGYRYGVDPVLIRIAFVVSTIFGGAGIVLYLAGWLLLNQAGDPSSAAESLFGKGRSSESQTKTIVLVVALAISVSTIGPVGMGLGGSGLISALLMLGGYWLLHQRQPLPPPLATGDYGSAASVTGYPGADYPVGQYNPAANAYSPYTRLPDSYVPDPPTPQPDPAVTLKEGTPEDTAPGHTAPGQTETHPTIKLTKPEPDSAPHDPFSSLAMPPSWDPLGVAPFAWDLPEPAGPAAAPVRIERTRSRLTSVVVGLAILAAAGAGAAAALGADWLTPGRIGAVALAVVGLGLVIGAFLRRGYGLLMVTGPLIGVVVLASMIGPIDFDRTTMGEHSWKPTTLADLQADYEVVMGSGKLDLTSLDLTKDTSVQIDAQLGNIEVLLPANMNVRKQSTIFAGETTGIPDGLDGGGDGTSGPVLTLDIDSRFASVEVHRG